MILSQFKKGQKQLAVLLDPDKLDLSSISNTIQRIEQAGASYVFVGGSLLFSSLEDAIVSIKAHTKLPVIIFPGGTQHLSKHADAILFLSLISGRNPDFLIGQQVISAPLIKQAGIEAISMGYVLIDGGKETTVSYISNTKPIPANKPEIATATCIAGEMLGLKSIYLEAGSGAEKPVPTDMITMVKKNTSIPLVVGGGIRTAEQLNKTFEAGADIAVIGTALERDFSLIESFGQVLTNHNLQYS